MQSTKRIEELVHILMQLKVLQFQGVWEGLNPRREETDSQVGTKHWQRICRRPGIHTRQSNQNLPSKIHATVKFVESGRCFDSIGSGNNLLIFQESTPGARSIYRTECQSPLKK